MTPAGVVPLDAAVDGPALVMLRPEDLRLTAGGDAEVELIEYYGHDTVYVVRPLSGPPLRVRAASAPEHERGASVSVTYQGQRSEEHTSELQSLMRSSYAVFCLKKKKKKNNQT